jgi:prephenate dehydrogenase
MSGKGGRHGLLLVGGYGKMGIWILEFLSSIGMAQGIPITITGPRETAGRRIAQQYGCDYVRDNVEAAARARYVVISTPLGASTSVLEEIAPVLDARITVMDICSVKSEICALARDLLKPDVEYVSVHPMFGPSVEGLEGQVVVIVPVRDMGFASRLRTFLEDHQARTITATPESHDRALAVVQCLTHFTYLSVGSTLKDLAFDLKQSRSFSSPIYELMLDMIGRILSGDPGMYAEIQMANPYSAEVEEIFIENARRLKAAVDSRDAEAFMRMMVEAGKHYDDLDAAFSKSARAVSALYEEYKKIRESVGSRVVLRNEVTGAIHMGVLKEMTPEYVTIGQGKRGRAIKTANVSLVPAGEARERRIRKYGTFQRDLSFIFPAHADPHAIAGILAPSVAEAVAAEVIDEYSGKGIPEGSKSITLRVSLFGDTRPEDGEEKVRSLLRSLGGLER